MPNSTFNKVTIKGLVSAIPDNPERISVKQQTASDLAFEAATELLIKSNVDQEQIGIILFLSTTPDYRSPATAMVLQNRLGINPDCIAFDINSGGSGFLHGLQVGTGLLQSISKDFALVLFGDTSSKQFLQEEENNLDYTDAASAMLLEKSEDAVDWHFSNYTRSEHYEKFILMKGGYRGAISQGDEEPYSGLSELAPLVIDSNIPFLQEQMIGKAIDEYFSNTGKNIKEFEYVFFDHNNLSDFSRIRESSGAEISQTPFNDTKNSHARGSFLPILMERFFSNSKKPLKTSCRILVVSFGEGLTVTVADLALDPSVVFQPLQTNSVYTEGSVTHEI